MEDYKVKYQLLGSNEDQVTEWRDKDKAKKKFQELKKSGKCIWAELLHSPLDEEESFYGEKVVEEFTNKVVEVLGIQMVVPAQEVCRYDDRVTEDQR